MVPEVVVLPMMVAGELSESMARSAASFALRPAVVPVAATDCSDTRTVLERSGSVTDRVPLALSAESVSVSGASARSVPATRISGASLVPVIVTVTDTTSLAGAPFESMTFRR